jgi:hypothetical protein
VKGNWGVEKFVRRSSAANKHQRMAGSASSGPANAVRGHHGRTEMRIVLMRVTFIRKEDSIL